jgi:uncharacterized protein (DUF952 family)
VILHLIPELAWRSHPTGEPLAPASLSTEGFVHCTAGDDLLLRVANALYRGERRSFVVLGIDERRLSAPVRWEAPPGADPLASEQFPHVYGPIDADAVVEVRSVVRAGDGSFVGFGPYDASA